MSCITSPSKLILPGLILVSIACAHGADRQREPSQKPNNKLGPPRQVCSRDSKYCVDMIATAGHPDECTLRLSAGGKTLAEFPTMGYLLDVFFSPDNAYVAINNRRANAGDYLWVISLHDGRAIKMPDDVAEDAGKKDVGKIAGAHWSDQSMPEVIALCPTCTSDDLRHSFLFSTGWTGSGELKVVEELEFSHGWMAVNNLCRLTETGLSVVNEKVVKEGRPSEVVKRAWTWSPFHTE
jgi:hypothetical protein